jgi:hypothetical protein
MLAMFFVNKDLYIKKLSAAVLQDRDDRKFHQNVWVSGVPPQ